MTPDEAANNLLAEFSWNKWFTDTFWRENELRIRMTMNDAIAHCGPPADVLDVGCASGFMAYLFSQLGYRVTATDAAAIQERPELFNRNGITFFESNLNELEPFPDSIEDSFDIVLFGEVIEHILNHPAGLLRSIARTLRPNGLRILSTPNPSTLMNAARVALGSFSLWGTSQFINEPKIKDGQIIDLGDVHYREYLTSEVQKMLASAGFTVGPPRYFGAGFAMAQSRWKKAIKSAPGSRRLLKNRVLGASQYFLAWKE
jgi:SAM-dependent methyltransferase